MNPQPTQSACPSCRQPAWVNPGYPVPCPRCGTQIFAAQPQTYAPPQAAQPQAWAPQQAWPPPQGAQSSPQAAQPQAWGTQQAAQPQAWGTPQAAQPQGWAPQQAASPSPAPSPQAAPPAQPKVSIKVGGFSVPIGAATARSPLKIVGIAVLAAAIGIAGFFVKSKFTTKKGTVSYASLGADASKPLADDLYQAPGKDAQKWKRDAMFWSLNFHAVRMDGTIDLGKPAVVEYVSPGNSASSSKKTRSDSLRRYTANDKGLATSSWGWNEPVKDLRPHGTPKCTIKQLLAKLSAEGVVKTPTVRVMFDPKFADFYAWTLYIDGAPKPLSFSWENCAPIK